MFFVASTGSLLASITVLAVFAAIVSAGIQHNVGDKAGWKLPSLAKINYTDWASQYSFQVEDTLHFRYDQGTESVLQVSLADYVSCSNSKPLATYDDGDTVVYLLRDGWYWFISGVPSHCNLGQKFSIRVQPLSHGSYQDHAPSAAEPSTATAQGFSGGSRRENPVAIPVSALPSSSAGFATPVFPALVYVLPIVLVA
ncbi:hypothetical protein SELMODRAFT_76299 [Selaginella moellendorffii]|uniref:Phytocyanin domain-containing protein n=1 Tax=Selaginella moellendorffii TaxID=88036 RepID=D8QR89_SELML|nr:mavicyanin [Selaginella moellendorffii]EFJ36738.1 hypothetical protein SELMODRAFT_76299 [Selaginella moellendorffii]|eukprot:XP_002961478.1 mavicyanin [Selaginella moellendorffii]